MSKTIVAPLFPLDSVVLVPGGVLPLHIFEPRYRAMVADALAGERFIAMAMPLAGSPVGETDRPPLHAVCGLGLIVQHEPLEDGRSNILLHGQERIRILEEIASDRPYRLGRGETVADVAAGDPDLGPRARDLLRRLDGLSEDQILALAGLPPGRLVDAALSALPVPAPEKHRICAIPDVAWRLHEVESLLDLLQGSRFRPEIRPDDPRSN